MFAKREVADDSISMATDSPSTVWINAIELNTRSLRDTARSVGLGGGGGKVRLSMESIERRRAQIRALFIVLLIIVCIAMAALAGVLPGSLPAWLPASYLVGFVFAVAAGFGVYIVLKERQLRRLAQFVMDEQFHTDVVNKRLKVVETLLESSKAVNREIDEQRAIDIIARQAAQFFDDAQIGFYRAKADRSVRLLPGQRDPGLAELAAAVVARGQSRLLRPSDGTGTTRFGVPVATGKKLYGALCLATERGVDTFEVLLAMSLFAEQAASAIAHARAREREKHDASRQEYDRAHDALTGLLARDEFLSRLDERLAAYGDDAPRVALLFINIDGMSRINNSLGYEIGDAVIRHYGERLAEVLPSDVLAGHFGGDEFMVARYDVSGYGDAEELADQITGAVGESLSVGSRKVWFSASIGMALPETYDTHARALVRDAQVAMQKARAAGGGQRARFDPGLLDAADRDLDLAGDLRRALEADEIDIQLQPIIDLDSGRPVAMEVLARWMHPEQGMIPASAFVPFAEGTTRQIDLRVVDKAVTAAAMLRQQGIELPMHLNLDPAHLADPGTADALLQRLADGGVDPATVVVEVTDADQQLGSEKVATTLSRLRQHGVGVALDDFGSGTSTLESVDRSRIDMIKISRGVVAGLDEAGSGRRELVDTIVSLARRLELTPVGVGVETDAQAEALKALGCRFAQGHYPGRPLSVAAFAERYAGTSASEGSTS